MFVKVNLSIQLKLEIPENADNDRLSEVLNELDYSFVVNEENRAEGYKLVDTEITDMTWDESSIQP